MPVGFKWFVPGLLDGSFGFGGEESAGASFLRRDGSVWTTDKDGILLALLASEILAVTGQSPSEHYAELTEQFGAPGVRAGRRAGHPRGEGEAGQALARRGHRHRAGRRADHRPKLTDAPGNGAAIGGLKVTTESAWFAARPSGTEDVYKIYAESFQGPEHLAQVQEEARAVVSAALAGDLHQIGRGYSAVRSWFGRPPGGRRKREPGASPGLPRSGERERPPS